MQYRQNIESQGTDNQLDVINTDIEQHYLELAKTMLVRLNDRYLAGLSLVNDTQIVAWFNNQPLHTTALSLTLIHNAMIKSTLGTDYSVHVTNFPLPFRIESTISLLMMAQNMGFQLATNISFAMAFVSSFYIMFYIKERVSKAKLLQYVSGLNVSSFWITSFLFDYATFILNSIVMILVLAVFQEDGWSTFHELMPGFITLIIFGFAMLPISFLSSHLFEIPSTGFVRMTIVYVFTGKFRIPKPLLLFLVLIVLMCVFFRSSIGITVFFVMVAMSFPAFKLADKADKMKWFFLVFPHYSLSSSLYNLNQMSTMNRVCKQRCDQIPICTDDLICFLIKECCREYTLRSFSFYTISTVSMCITYGFHACFDHFNGMIFFSFVHSNKNICMERARYWPKFDLHGCNGIRLLYHFVDH